MYGVKKKKPKFTYLNSSPTTCQPLNGKNTYRSIRYSHFYINLTITQSANSTFIEFIKQLLKLYNFITNETNCLPSLPSCRLCLHRFPGANLTKHCQMFTLSKAKKIQLHKLSAVLPNLLEKSTNSRLLSLSKVNVNHHFCLETVAINKAFSLIFNDFGRHFWLIT